MSSSEIDWSSLRLDTSSESSVLSELSDSPEASDDDSTLFMAETSQRGAQRGHYLPDGRHIPPDVTPLNWFICNKGVTDFSVSSKEGKRWNCHKTVLRDSSAVLDAMLSERWWDPVKLEIDLGLSEAALNMYMNYLHLQQNPLQLDWKEEMTYSVAVELLEFSHRMDIAGLFRHCEDVLLGNEPTDLSVDFAIDLYFFCCLIRRDRLNVVKFDAVRLLQWNGVGDSPCLRFYSRMFPEETEKLLPLIHLVEPHQLFWFSD